MYAPPCDRHSDYIAERSKPILLAANRNSCQDWSDLIDRIDDYAYVMGDERGDIPLGEKKLQKRTKEKENTANSITVRYKIL